VGLAIRHRLGGLSTYTESMPLILLFWLYAVYITDVNFIVIYTRAVHVLIQNVDLRDHSLFYLVIRLI